MCTSTLWMLLVLAMLAFLDKTTAPDIPAFCPAGWVFKRASRVLILGVETSDYLYRAQDVQYMLQSTNTFGSVDVASGADTAPPTLSQLLYYDAVLVYAAAPVPAGTGDVLADYWDRGGGVVVMCNANNQERPLGGRFGNASLGYALLDETAPQNAPRDSLGAVADPQSPLMTGVTSLFAVTAHRSLGAVVNNGTVVARWASDGSPLAVARAQGCRATAALNFFPPSYQVRDLYWTGDGAALMRNALVFSTCRCCGGGTFAELGASACRGCAAGTFSTTVAAAAAGACSGCLSGTYWTGTGASVCAECAEGTFSLGTGASGCLGCPAGMFGVASGVVHPSWFIRSTAGSG